MTFRMGSRPRKDWAIFPAGTTPEENNTERNANIAITVLALDPEESTERSDWGRDEEMPEQKLVQEFQTRRKYSNFRKLSRKIPRDKTLLELGLSGTKYRLGETRGGSVEPQRSLTSRDVERPGLRKGSLEDRASLYSRLALPPISPRSSRSENTTPFPSNFNSLLNSDFGFKKQSSDSFSGIYPIKRTLVPSELERELEIHAKRHIYACHNLGSIRKGSRAAQSVYGLKQTMSNGVGTERGLHTDTDNLDKSRSFQRKKPVVSHRTYPSLTQLFLKPTVNPEDGLPVINGNSLLTNDESLVNDE